MERAAKWSVLVVMLIITAEAFAQSPLRGPRRGEAGGPPQRGAQEGDYRGPPAPMPRRGRMSPEERQQLRRDIHDANRDLYRDPPGRGPSRQQRSEPRGR